MKEGGRRWAPRFQGDSMAVQRRGRSQGPKQEETPMSPPKFPAIPVSRGSVSPNVSASTAHAHPNHASSLHRSPTVSCNHASPSMTYTFMSCRLVFDRLLACKCCHGTPVPELKDSNKFTHKCLVSAKLCWFSCLHSGHKLDCVAVLASSSCALCAHARCMGLIGAM